MTIHYKPGLETHCNSLVHRENGGSRGLISIPKLGVAIDRWTNGHPITIYLWRSVNLTFGLF
jgi:hypothetical protein